MHRKISKRHLDFTLRKYKKPHDNLEKVDQDVTDAIRESVKYNW